MISIQILLIFLFSFTLTSSVHIVCDYKSIEFTDHRFYSCDGEDFYTNSNFHSIVSIDGVHLTNKSLNDVQGIRLWDEKCNLQFFPKNLISFFPNLIAIWFSDCMITEVRLENFEGLENLIELDLSWNQLQLLHGNLFKNFRNLQFLYLNDNRIAYIGPNLLQPLKSIVSVSLSNNICIDGNFFDFENENSQMELRNFIIDVAIQCPMTLEIIEEYFGLEKIENRKNLMENFEKVGKIKSRNSQEKLKLEIHNRLAQTKTKL